MQILAVCTGNICRSPMAEGILKRIIEDNNGIKVSSAGTQALDGNPPSEFALICAYEQGIDISGHRSQALHAGIIRRSKIILCMEPLHMKWIFSLVPSAFGSVCNLAEFSGDRKLKKIPDPYGSSLREYRECFRSISSCLDNFVSSGLLD